MDSGVVRGPCSGREVSILYVEEPHSVGGRSQRRRFQGWGCALDQNFTQSNPSNRPHGAMRRVLCDVREIQAFMVDMYFPSLPVVCCEHLWDFLSLDSQECSECEEQQAVFNSGCNDHGRRAVCRLLIVHVTPHSSLCRRTR